MALSDSVLATIRRYALVSRGGRVVVALSGGPDSVALVHLLRALECQGELTLAGLAHLNHRLRAAASDADAAFCRAFADELGLPIHVGQADVRTVSREEKRSIEDAARKVRYAFLETAADHFKADVIAVGHSRDDQAETFLLRLIRGAGTRGLGSIRPKAGRVVRPLIETSRAELRQYAAERGLRFREDESNGDVSVPRNRIRHELLPYLQREFSPGIIDVLAREAALAQDDEGRLQEEAIDLAASIVLVNTAEQSVCIDAGGIRSAHPALRSRVARHALAHFGVERYIGFDHVGRLLDLVDRGRPGQTLSLPGQQAVHEGERILLKPPAPRTRVGPGHPDTFRLPLAVPGEATARGWCLNAERLSGSGLQGGPQAGDVFGVRVRPVDGELAVRFRRPGDRFEPPGLGGLTKKLQDYFVDRKVARADRDRLPLVVDADDRIVWVVGHGVSEGYRAQEPSSGVILLKARRLGGEV